MVEHVAAFGVLGRDLAMLAGESRFSDVVSVADLLLELELLHLEVARVVALDDDSALGLVSVEGVGGLVDSRDVHRVLSEAARREVLEVLEVGLLEENLVAVAGREV